jgi:RHS repeat-associated protein
VSYSGSSDITRGSGAGAVTYRFDARGNCTNAAAASTPRFFSYDSDNNIIAASVGPTNWTFRYNAQNQMAYSKLQVSGATADERCYLYDGLDCIAEVSPAGEVYREFIRAGAIGGVVAEIIHNDLTVPAQYRDATFFYQYNHRGDVIAVTDDAGTLVWQCDYDAFGLPLSIDPAPFTPRFSFSTKRYFAELGTYYYGYRWYLPELCRWMQRDPIKLRGGSFNFYNLCANNSTCYNDAYGLQNNYLNTSDGNFTIPDVPKNAVRHCDIVAASRAAYRELDMAHRPKDYVTYAMTALIRTPYSDLDTIYYSDKRMRETSYTYYEDQFVVHQDAGIVDQGGIHAQMKGGELNYHLMGATQVAGNVRYDKSLFGIVIWKLGKHVEFPPSWQTLYMWERGRRDSSRVTDD